MNMNGMNFESKRQELARRLVDREIYYCVSSLVGTLSTLAQNCGSRVLRDECLDWEEDILPLLEWVDYEEALRQHVTEGADLDDMRNMVEEWGYWGDFLFESVGYDVDNPPQTKPDEDGDTEDIDLEAWFAADQERYSDFRDKVADFLIENGDTKELCQQFDVNTDDFRGDIYEHWLTSDWLARKLKERGETIGELCGLTIWGRGCTGMSMTLDSVMQSIACDLWSDEWDLFIRNADGNEDGSGAGEFV